LGAEQYAEEIVEWEWFGPENTYIDEGE